MPHERVQSDNSSDEVLANREMLAQVFGDRDHRYYTPKERAVSSSEGHNLRDELGRVTFFDTEPILDNALESYNREHTKASLQLLLNKLEELESRLNGAEGKKFFDSVARTSNAFPQDFHEPGSPGATLFTMDDIYNTLMRNIQATKTQVRARLSEFESQHAA